MSLCISSTMGDQPAVWLFRACLSEYPIELQSLLNFTPKGYANSRAQGQGLAAKFLDQNTNMWHYAIICGNTQLHGEEGK